LTDVLTERRLLGRQFEISGVDGQRLQARIEETASTSGEILIFIEDVGRIREQAQQLKLASLGRLTASIAHEIRNPLSAIGHAGELLREERRGAMQDRLLNILADNVSRLDRIVTDVLELGRRERTQQEMLSLQEACEQFMDNFLVSEGLDTRILELDVANDWYVCFDRAHFHQVLWNLVGNAVRHSQGKPSSVRIFARASANRERVELHVLDDGAGVPEAVKEQIFEPFFTTHHKGTGLGLFIARELCEANAASLDLLSDDTGGHFVISGRAESCR